MFPNDGPATPAETIWINDELRIPVAELRFRFSRSSGPGGQHVNRSETRVELLWDVAASPQLTEAQRSRLLARLAGYLDSDGQLRIVSAATRSQLDNRGDAMERFAALVRAALRPSKRRVPTRPSAAARERRLADKRQRSTIKSNRGPVTE
jgi:ribosome-associated protein